MQYMTRTTCGMLTVAAETKTLRQYEGGGAEPFVPRLADHTALAAAFNTQAAQQLLRSDGCSGSFRFRWDGSATCEIWFRVRAGG